MNLCDSCKTGECSFRKDRRLVHVCHSHDPITRADLAQMQEKHNATAWDLATEKVDRERALRSIAEWKESDSRLRASNAQLRVDLADKDAEIEALRSELESTRKATTNEGGAA